KIMWSKTLKWFYLIPLVIVIIVFIVNYGAILWKAIYLENYVVKNIKVVLFDSISDSHYCIYS
ncbi:hypothetical protein DW972_15370, partial [Anaerobutyricum hallii]